MDNITCSTCGATVNEIGAAHSYLIEYSNEQEKWVKSIGDVIYSCPNCGEELNTIEELQEILKQVDEL